MAERSEFEAGAHSWHDRVAELNRETSRLALEAHERGERATARGFLWEPVVRGIGALVSGRGFDQAVVASYGTLLRTAKLWEMHNDWTLRDYVVGYDWGVQWIVREDWRAELKDVVEGRDEGQPVSGGRGGVTRLATSRGTAYVRRFRRGGAMRWLGETYFGFGYRPFQEFWLLRLARRRGLPVPEPLAARVEARFGVLYSGSLVTAEISDATTLWDAVEDGDGRALFRDDLGPALRRVHDAGLWHPDLNLRNILVHREGGFSLVDLDRARFVRGPLPPRLRRRSLRRIERSLRRLDPDGERVTAEDLRTFEDAYWREGV